MVKCSKAEVRRLRTALRWKIPAAQRQRIQMVLLRESGMAQPAIAAAMGVSLSTVNRAHMAYDDGGIKALKPKLNGGRKHENMTLAEEKALLARFAKAAGAGEMLNIHDLKAAYEKAIGHPTSDSTVYNLLHRHGWRKLMPRPFHPKRDSECFQSHWCIPGCLSHLSDVHAKRMLQERLTQWKTGSPVKLARGHSLLNSRPPRGKWPQRATPGPRGFSECAKRGAYGAAGFRTAGERLSIPPNGRQRCQEQQRLVGRSSWNCGRRTPESNSRCSTNRSPSLQRSDRSSVAKAPGRSRAASTRLSRKPLDRSVSPRRAHFLGWSESPAASQNQAIKEQDWLAGVGGFELTNALPKLALEVWPEFPFISERLAIRDFSRLSCQRVTCTPVQSIRSILQ